MKRLTGVKTHNQSPATIDEINEWRGSQQINFIHSFTSLKRKTKVFFFMKQSEFISWICVAEMKKYYNSKLIILNMKQRQKLFGFVNV